MKVERFGWTGKILLLDLSTGERTTLSPPPEVYAAGIGGRGLGGLFLRGRATLACEDPDMPLVIAAGPLAGSGAPGADLCRIVTRSPLTGAVGDGCADGRLGVELKRAGWDAVVLTGRGLRPCGVEIENDRVRLTDASKLADQDAREIHALLRTAKRGCATLVAGPAADSGCLFASLVADGAGFAGRCGLGRTAGLKNLKYIAVRGSGRINIADPAGLERAREDILRLVAAAPALTGEQGLAHFGTGCLFDLTDSRGMMPTDNFRRTRFPGAGELNAPAYAARYLPQPEGCPDCPVRCRRRAADGRRLPEFPAMSHFTALIGNRDMELVMRANDFCLRQGLDPVSAAAVLACRREISGENMDAERIVALLHGMAEGRGEGEGLGRGAARYAAAAGLPELAMCVKGLELPAFDPRGAYGMALSCAVSTCGGEQERACAVHHEILRKPVATDRFSFEGKARIVKLAEDVYAAADSLVACKPLFLAASMEEYARAYAAVTGRPMTAGELAAAGERIDYQERIFNAQNGFSAADDDLPPRFFAEPGDGTREAPVPPIPRKAFLAARAAYYRIRGLSPEGRPTPEKAQALGLELRPRELLLAEGA